MTDSSYDSSRYTKEKGPIAWMAGNSVAANLLMAIFLVGGLFMGFSTKQEVFPETQSDMITVSITYPGASPEEVEKGIVLAVEDAIEHLEGVGEIRSVANEGFAVIMAEALEGADINRLWQEIGNEIERISTFPDEAEKPTIAIANRKIEVLRFALYGDLPDFVLRNVADHVRDMLIAHEDITQVELMGARDREIHVDVPAENLRRYGMTLSDIARIISKSSLEMGAGTVKTQAGDVLLRIKDRRNSAQEYARLPVISNPDGSRMLLEDMATVTEGFEESDSWGSFNGKKAILLSIYRVGEQTPFEVASAAREVINEVRSSFPQGMGIAKVRDMSKIFIQRADLLLSNAYIGLALVFIVLALFLEIRLAFWVSLGIPISFLGSFLLLAPTDFSINVITMFAYIVTLGIVVDDAVVVGENVYYYRGKGLSLIQASVMGTRTVAMPVIFSVITNMVAFLPILFLPGIMGRMYKLLPLVVIAVFFVSLIESLFILPAHLSGHGKTGASFFPLNVLEKWQRNFSSRFEHFVRRTYGTNLSRLIEHRYSVVAGALALLLITLGYVLSGRMGMVLSPKVESDYAFCQAELPYGAASSMLRSVESSLVKAAEQVVSQHGGKDLSTGISSHVRNNQVKVYLQLTAPDVRPLHTSEVTSLWRKEVGKIPGIESLSFESDRGGPGFGKDLTVSLSHRNQDILESAAQELARNLSRFSMVQDIDDGRARGKEQIDITLNEVGQRMGLTSREVALQVRHAFQGAIAVRNQRGNDEVSVRVRLPMSQRSSLVSYEDLVLQSPQGEIFLKDAANIVEGRAYTSIQRTNGKREILVTANVRPVSQTPNILKDMKENMLPELLGRYPGLAYEFSGRRADVRESTQSLLNGLGIALFCIFALLAVPFQSYLQPLIIMFSIPFGVIGAIGGHLIMGYSLSVVSLFGIVALSGVVVNDGLVLIDLVNQKIRKGISLKEAVVQSGIQRFRPILLTTLTTCGGLTPMILETSRQARFLIPMAISLGFGLLFATIITLGLVPCLYVILEDIKNIVMPKNQDSRLG